MIDGARCNRVRVICGLRRYRDVQHDAEKRLTRTCAGMCMVIQTFHLHFDASDAGITGVLIQKGNGAE